MTELQCKDMQLTELQWDFDKANETICELEKSNVAMREQLLRHSEQYNQGVYIPAYWITSWTAEQATHPMDIASPRGEIHFLAPPEFFQNLYDVTKGVIEKAGRSVGTGLRPPAPYVPMTCRPDLPSVFEDQVPHKVENGRNLLHPAARKMLEVLRDLVDDEGLHIYNIDFTEDMDSPLEEAFLSWLDAGSPLPEKA